MAERRIKVPFPPPNGPETDASEVPVSESHERWSEVTLEDGTVLRIKTNVVGALRIDNQYDAEGNPIYAIKSANVVSIASAPAHLRRGGAASRGVH